MPVATKPARKPARKRRGRPPVAVRKQRPPRPPKIKVEPHRCSNHLPNPELLPPRSTWTCACKTTYITTRNPHIGMLWALKGAVRQQ